MPDALVEIEAIGSRGDTTGVPTGSPTWTAHERPARRPDGRHSGKAGAREGARADYPLATPDGWTTMGAVQVGDKLLGADGRPITVLAATEVMHGRPCYEVHFSDGEVISPTVSISGSPGPGLPGDTTPSSEVTGAVTPSCATSGHDHGEDRGDQGCRTADARPNRAVQISAPLQLPAADLPIPPYAFGCWLGDGHSAGARITVAEPELLMHIEASGIDAHPQSGKFLATASRCLARRPRLPKDIAWSVGAPSGRRGSKSAPAGKSAAVRRGSSRLPRRFRLAEVRRTASGLVGC